MSEHDTGCLRKLKLPIGVSSSALIDEQYRYWLKHVWGDLPYVAFFMMNPSGADETVTDNTVAKCDRLAKRWGFGATIIGNACAYRAKDPKELLKQKDPAGPGNLEAWDWILSQAEFVVIAHGRLPGKLQPYADKMVAHIRTKRPVLNVLKLLPGGVPAHPLGRGKGHIPEDIIPQEWL
jgi:hypothetical protein